MPSDRFPPQNGHSLSIRPQRPIADVLRLLHYQTVIGHLRHVTPTYGWGWVSTDGVGRGTPEPFRFGCDGANGTEGIILGDHEFAGATVRLSPRHTTRDGHFNVEIRREGVMLAQGYAEA